jgi:hypothetical protein
MPWKIFSWIQRNRGGGQHAWASFIANTPRSDHVQNRCLQGGGGVVQYMLSISAPASQGADHLPFLLHAPSSTCCLQTLRSLDFVNPFIRLKLVLNVLFSSWLPIVQYIVYRFSDFSLLFPLNFCTTVCCLQLCIHFFIVYSSTFLLPGN